MYCISRVLRAFGFLSPKAKVLANPKHWLLTQTSAFSDFPPHRPSPEPKVVADGMAGRARRMEKGKFNRVFRMSS